MPAIILSTLNARFIHASLGLRYLLANLGELRGRALLREFTIARAATEIVDELLLALDSLPDEGERLQIIGFGVYIWNVVQTTEVVRLLRAKRPAVNIVLGGPEVSYEPEDQAIVALADHVIAGWSEASFPALCRALERGERLPKFIVGERLPLAEIQLPYDEYSDADLAHRLLYVEASRGCPFKCEFCLSALDDRVEDFDPACFLAAMHGLYRRGARNFKFVDRTFNLKIAASERILQFFLDRLDESPTLFVHFEVIPDRFPERLKTLIARFPPGVLQFEVGIQSFNPQVQQRISRRQDEAKSIANLRWLVDSGKVHVHADLIFGLPGETLESFAAGFDRLYALQPHEIQLGFLKRLRGTPIIRHSAAFGMVYDPAPPYTVLSTAAVDVLTLSRMHGFARLWDRLANSGRFRRSLALLLSGDSPFYAFLAFSERFWQQRDLGEAQRTGLTPEALVDALYDDLCAQGWPEDTVQQALLADYQCSSARGSPRCLRGLLSRQVIPTEAAVRLAQRQARHRDQETE